MTNDVFHCRSVGGGCRCSTCCVARAFSLVELTAVVVIIGILAGVGVPRYVAFLANQRVQAAARRVMADLAMVQRRARVSSKTETVQFIPSQEKYLAAGVDDPDHPGLDYEVDLSAEPYRASMTFVNLGDDVEIHFDAYGVPDSDGTIIITVGQYSVLIYVDPTDGRATAIESDADGGFDLTPLPISKLPPGGAV